MLDVIVVGGGVTGATAARLLGAEGMSVTVLDDSRPGGGTGPSGGHLRPGWFRGLPEEEYGPAIEHLERAWGVVREDYLMTTPRSPEPRPVEMLRVDVDRVIASPREAATVTSVAMLHNYPLVGWTDAAGEPREERCRLLVVAAGAWVRELLPGFRKITPKRGVSFRVRGTLPAPVVRQWAPYKQVVAHQQSPGEVWVGDGTAIIDKNWTADREAVSLARCLGAVPGAAAANATPRTGLRPYCTPDRPSDPCVLRRLGPRAWACTGAGKSGFIAAGWAAWKILKDLPA